MASESIKAVFGGGPSQGVSKILIALTGRSGCGKNTIAGQVQVRLPLANDEFSWPMKEGLMVMLGLSEKQMEGAGKDVVIPRYGRTPRELLKSLGTGWGQDMVHPGVWIETMSEVWDAVQHKNHDVEGLIITDLMSESQANWVRFNGGTVVHVVAEWQASVPDLHASDVGVESIEGDLLFSGDSKSIAHCIVAWLKAKKYFDLDHVLDEDYPPEAEPPSSPFLWPVAPKSKPSTEEIKSSKVPRVTVSFGDHVFEVANVNFSFPATTSDDIDEQLTKLIDGDVRMEAVTDTAKMDRLHSLYSAHGPAIPTQKVRDPVLKSKEQIIKEENELDERIRIEDEVNRLRSEWNSPTRKVEKPLIDATGPAAPDAFDFDTGENP